MEAEANVPQKGQGQRVGYSQGVNRLKTLLHPILQMRAVNVIGEDNDYSGYLTIPRQKNKLLSYKFIENGKQLQFEIFRLNI